MNEEKNKWNAKGEFLHAVNIICFKYRKLLLAFYTAGEFCLFSFREYSIVMTVVFINFPESSFYA